MNQTDITKLWTLLKELYPRQRQPETQERMLAWELALEPYAYDDIKAAALAHARESDYYPSIAELTSKLPKKHDDERPQRDNSWMDKYIEEEDKLIEARGGTCPIIRKYGGIIGETIRAHAPQECCGCRKKAVSGCSYESMYEVGA